MIEPEIKTVLLDRIRKLSSPMEPVPVDMNEHLEHIPGIRAVVFDIYGTLFISGSGDISISGTQSNVKAMTDSLVESGFSIENEQTGQTGVSLLHEYINKDHEIHQHEHILFPEVEIRSIWDDVLCSLKKDKMISGEIDRESVRRVALEYECHTNPVWPMPGIIKTLHRLKSREMELGIVSNSQFYTPLMFDALLDRSLDDFGFNGHWCAWSFRERESKPSPFMFTLVLDALDRYHGILPSETMFVGNDMLNDMLPASQSGMKTCLFAGDKRSLRMRADDRRCKNLHPDLTITSLSHLADSIF